MRLSLLNLEEKSVVTDFVERVKSLWLSSSRKAEDLNYTIVVQI